MASDIPSVSPWLQWGFHQFLPRFLGKHFHAIGIDRESRCEHAIDVEQPLIVYGNHPSWWDPLMAHFLNGVLFPSRQFFAPIDATALEQYQVFAKLGFYPVKMHCTRGAGTFLTQSLAILNAQDTAIWMTPEGRFADARDRSGAFMPGLAHLCSRMDGGFALPMALEYVFWDERLPVCLILLGKPVGIADRQSLTKEQWKGVLEHELRVAQDRLATLAMARNSEPFDVLLHGKIGAGKFYDSVRRLAFWRRAGKTRFKHGDQFE